VSGVAADVAIPVGFWRSVGNSHNGFFHECFLDEIATKAARDPIELRLELMGNWPTAVKVLEKLAAMSNWGAKPDSGRARGVAFTLSFGTWVGEVVEVSVAPGGIRIEKVWCVADVGGSHDAAGPISAHPTSRRPRASKRCGSRARRGCRSPPAC
jgi:isoquinoline 1-oxidoreductase beta subunit